MMKYKNNPLNSRRMYFLFLLGIISLLSACSSQPINYYLIEMPLLPSTSSTTALALSQEPSSNNSENQTDQALQGKQQNIDNRKITTGVNLSGPVIALSQVLIPQYLDRPQLVTREHNVDFTIVDNNRWGEELPSGIARVLSISLSKHLTSIGATTSPLRIGLSPDYTINIEILAFEGILNGDVRLRALWTLDASSKNREARERASNSGSGKLWQAFFDKSMPAGTNYASYVEAYGALVDALGLEIGNVFLSLYKK